MRAGLDQLAIFKFGSNKFFETNDSTMLENSCSIAG